MSLITRSAMIQARVFPPVKEASERVLWRLGLTMSEAMELFLRRIIVEERIPFDIVALDPVRLGGEGSAPSTKTRAQSDRSRRGRAGGVAKKIF